MNNLIICMQPFSFVASIQNPTRKLQNIWACSPHRCNYTRIKLAMPSVTIECFSRKSAIPSRYVLIHPSIFFTAYAAKGHRWAAAGPSCHLGERQCTPRTDHRSLTGPQTDSHSHLQAMWSHPLSQQVFDCGAQKGPSEGRGVKSGRAQREPEVLAMVTQHVLRYRDAWKFVNSDDQMLLIKMGVLRDTRPRVNCLHLPLQD